MLQWQIGDVKVTRVVESELPMAHKYSFLRQATPEALREMPWLYPHFVQEDGAIVLSVHALLVEAPGLKLVVDTCIGNDKQGRKVPTWNHLNNPFLETMTAAGYPADSIDTVLCTHLHVDHVGWNTRLSDGKWVPTFPNARYVFGKIEYDYWAAHSDSDEHKAVFDDSVRPVVEAGRVDLVASDHKLSDEITLIPTPGHSPGHMSIHIVSDGESALLTGDVAHHPCQMAHHCKLGHEPLLCYPTRQRWEREDDPLRECRESFIFRVQKAESRRNAG